MDFRERFDAFDSALVRLTSCVGLHYLRVSVAIVFIWFGALKIFGLSPANYLVERTVFWFNPSWFIPALGVWEIIIGLCFLYPRFVRFGILLLIPQMMGTFLPLIFLRDITFQGGNLLLPTMEGQYIIKNLVIISAAMVIGSHVRDRQRTTPSSASERSTSTKRR